VHAVYGTTAPVGVRREARTTFGGGRDANAAAVGRSTGARRRGDAHLAAFASRRPPQSTTSRIPVGILERCSPARAISERIGLPRNIRRRAGSTSQPGRTLTLLRKGTVEGRVVDSAGRAILGAIVSAETEWGSELEGGQGICSDDGRYRLTDLAPGKVFLRARRNAGSSSVTQAVKVLQGAVIQLDFTFVETGVLTGKVSRAGKPPAETVWVQAYGADGFASLPERVKA